MNKFRDDNTNGYTVEQLAELNWRYAERLTALPADSRAEKSVRDHVAERVLAEYDAA